MNVAPPLVIRPRYIWERLLRHDARPGYISSIPYLLVLRWLLPIPVIARTILHEPQYAPTFLESVLSIMLSLLYAGIATWLHLRSPTVSPKLFYLPIALSDIIFVSWLYYTTGKIQSTYFLLYLLPLLVAAEYLDIRSVAFVCCAVAAAYAATLYAIYPHDPARIGREAVVVKVYLAREGFFFLLAAFASVLVRVNRIAHQNLVEATQLLRSLAAFRLNTDSILEEDEIYSCVVDTVAKCNFTLYVSFISFEDGGSKRHDPRGLLEFSSFRSACNGLMQDLQTRDQRRLVYAPHLMPDADGLRQRHRRINIICTPLAIRGKVAGAIVSAHGEIASLAETVQDFLHNISLQSQAAIERVRILRTLSMLGAETARAIELDLELNNVLRALIDDDGCTTARLWRRERDQLQLVKSRHASGPHLPVTALCENLPLSCLLSDRVTILPEAVGSSSLSPGDLNGARGARVIAPLTIEGRCIGCLDVTTDGVETVPASLVRRLEVLRQTYVAAIARHYPRSALLTEITAKSLGILGADSGTLHVYSDGKELYAEAAGLADQEFLRTFPPRANGIGRAAIRLKAPVCVDDPVELKRIHPLLYGWGARSMAAFPLALGSGTEGVLYVHYLSPHPVTKAELRIGELFSRQIEVAIQNELVSRSLLTEADRAWQLSQVQNFIQSLPATSELDALLNQVAETVYETSGADNITLYLCHPDSRATILRPIVKGTFLVPDRMRGTVTEESVVRSVLTLGKHKYVEDLSAEPNLARPGGFADRENIQSFAALILKAPHPPAPVGLLFVNYRKLRRIPPSSRRYLEALAASAAIAIANARAHTTLENALAKRRREISALKAVDEEIVRSARDFVMARALDLLVSTAMNTTEAQAGMVLWHTPGTTELQMRASRGFPTPFRQDVAKGLIGKAARDRVAILATDVTSPEWRADYVEILATTRSELAVPLIDNGRLLGVVNLEHSAPNAFSPDDAWCVESLALQLVILLHTMELSNRLVDELKFKTCLVAFARSVQGVRLDTALVQRFLLTCLTAGEGLGFSRAIAFMLDEGGKHLRGTIAVGALSLPEAERNWDRAQGVVGGTAGTQEDRLIRLMEAAESLQRAVETGGAVDCPMSRVIADRSFPLEVESALSRCLRNGAPIIVGPHQEDILRSQLPEVVSQGDGFACVPLISGEPVGVLFIDNRFISGECNIDESRLSAAKALADFAALYITNARLRRGTRIRAYQDLNHQLQTPIGIALHLTNKIAEADVPQSVKRDALLARAAVATSDRIAKGVRIFADLDLYGKLRTSRAPVRCSEILEWLLVCAIDFKVLSGPEKGLYIQVDESQLTANAKVVLPVDKSLFQQAVRNILDNACKYSDPRTAICITPSLSDTALVIRCSSSSARNRIEPEEVALAVTHGWRGVNASLTTSEGSGIGLWIVNAIMEAHGGRLRIFPTEPTGVTNISMELPRTL